MALQLASTSTEHPSGTGQPASQPTSQQPFPNGPDNGNSIPFSFLIAFLALFVAFMAMGLWARRISLFVRRRLGLPIPEPRLKHAENKKPVKPIIWDVSFGRDGDVVRWNRMQPLSSWYRREVLPLPDDDSSEQGASDTSANLQPAEQLSVARAQSIAYARVPGRGGRGMVLAPLAPPRRHPRREGASNLRQLRNSMMTSLTNYWRPSLPGGTSRASKGEGKVEALQLAVFITMPSAIEEKRRSSSLGGITGDLAIGIADIAWEMGEGVLDGD